MAEERRLAHVGRIPIRWGDMDAMGHVNNTVYFRYMEQARMKTQKPVRIPEGIRQRLLESEVRT